MKSLQSPGINPGVLAWTNLVTQALPSPWHNFFRTREEPWNEARLEPPVLYYRAIWPPHNHHKQLSYWWYTSSNGDTYSLCSLCCGAAKQTCTIWPPPQAERDTFRNKLKLLKDLVVKEGFVKSGISLETSQPDWKKHALEDSLDNLQDGIADLKRKLTEVVECWNIKWGSVIVCQSV